MAETIFSVVILLVSIMPIIILGIVQYRSKEPVGFWSGKEPPKREQITDVRAYNRRHGLMWITYGVGYIVCFVCGLPFGGMITGFLCMIEGLGGILVMVLYHNRLNRMYYRKQRDL